VAKVPEELAVIVDEQFGAGEDVAGGQFEEEEGEDVILVGRWVVGNAGNEAASVKGEEEVGVIDIVQREHGAAIEEITRRERHEAEVFEVDSAGRAGGRIKGGGQKEAEEREEQQQRTADIAGRTVER
jgi:hypothetical protein